MSPPISCLTKDQRDLLNFLLEDAGSLTEDNLQHFRKKLAAMSPDDDKRWAVEEHIRRGEKRAKLIWDLQNEVRSAPLC